ncbi:meckelin-like isoform X2 [Mercenaria mercenaria]|uniref:meckelin-like isoform X2 n=1 Tax=Mercenaria mercenaria TaxID=6596 RepID=UPI00234F395A|nr:meckelin-like isoform X2 [Mercenaria mercenaria]XP_053401622.1 meckelin-like isoform X2 [Mercenaria mercenaria]
MAVIKKRFILLIYILSNIYCIQAQLSQLPPIPLVDPSNCNTVGTVRQYFDTTRLECVDCSQDENFQVTSPDGFSCICKLGFKYKQSFGGNVTCEACPAGQVASSTGYNCLKCPAGVDTTTNTCASCNGTLEISPERQLLGQWYTEQGTQVNTISCQQCSDGTQPSADKTRCEKCTNVLPVSGDNSCNCPTSTNEFTGGFCIPKSYLGNIAESDSLYQIPRTVDQVSEFLRYNLKASYALCNVNRNQTACNVLANMCVLTLYEYRNKDFQSSDLNNACEVYLSAWVQAGSLKYVPTLYYAQISVIGLLPMQGDDVLQNDFLQTQYTFSPVSRLEYRLVRYNIHGEYLGLSTVQNGRIQLCADTTDKQNAAFVFGTTYSQSCKIAAINLWDQSMYPAEFYDLYLEINQNDVKQLYPTPVNILNYRSLDQSSSEINRGEQKDMELFRRFFLVDNIGTISAAGDQAQMVRYAKSIRIDVQLQTDTTQGIIYPPALQIEYGTVSLADAQAGGEVDVSFTVDYSYSDTSYRRDFQIAVGTLSTLGVIYAGYRSWVWSKRSGRPSIDFPTIANFFFFCAGTLANVFFVITFGMAFYWFIFFKRQSVVYLVHPTDKQLRDWLGLFGAAFALKFLEVAHMIFMQCSIDVFFIDWERSRGVVSNSAETTKTKEVPVSIWRTYFVANEWNEIQAVRKINKTFQVWAAVFFLVVVGFENTATKDPDGSVTKDSNAYKAEYSRVYRYAVAVLVYVVIGVLQWIFFTFIYERFFEDKVRQFVDLCSMSNISVFVMAHAQYGHYIHGRSVHGKADTNMKEMAELMKKEEEDMCGQRGLLPNTEQQTFVMALPKRLRLRYEAVLLPAQLESAAAATRAEAGRGGRLSGSAMEKQVEAYATINRFFSAFIDRSLRDIDYVIKDKTFLESIMDTEFDDTSETGVFYNDDGHSFDKVLFYGHEMTLLLFDVLTFCISDLIFTNYVIAGVITYLLSEMMCIGRDGGGRKNLSKKTLVDERFLI